MQVSIIQSANALLLRKNAIEQVESLPSLFCHQIQIEQQFIEKQQLI